MRDRPSPNPQYQVVSPLTLNSNTSGALLANATPAVISLSCPLPAFGGSNGATLAVQSAWDW